MNFTFINNDTIAVAGLVAIAIVGLIMQSDNVVSAAVGAIGGYIGSKAVSNNTTNTSDPDDE